MIVEVRGVIDTTLLTLLVDSLTLQGIQHLSQMITHPLIHLVHKGITLLNRGEQGSPFGANRTHTKKKGN